MKKLTAKEQLFCLFYQNLRCSAEAAAKAGYCSPERAGIRLLKRRDILSEIDRLAKSAEITSEEITAGYRRIAFGSTADVMKLLITGELPPEGIDALNLFNVSEIKKPKDGALEIKFFDRLKALEHLEALSGTGSDGAAPLYEALLRSTKGDSDLSN